MKRKSEDYGREGKRMKAEAGEGTSSSDMFASSSGSEGEGEEQKKGERLDASLLDTWDDVEGHYKVIVGELMEGRYLVKGTLGKGMFATVIRAEDKSDDQGQLVAIKVIRNNETMRRGAQKEVEILEKLNEAGKKGIVRLLRTFEHKDHMCLVFENLSSNLREVVKKYGRENGLNIRAVRIYARQLLIGLSLLRKCGYVHADVKPDNILVNETNTIAKIADLGSAMTIDEVGETPYLVSRFYRAPEIILGVKHDYAVDMWSLACSLYEIYTGKVLFPGRTNNDMVRLMMESRGKFSHRLLRRGSFTNEHFDPLQLDFQSLMEDTVTGRMLMKTTKHVGPFPESTLKGRLKGLEGESSPDAASLDKFIDLLDRMLMLNPDKRITPEDALNHPFVKD
jgi:serine/threonine-protein kinase PRP4